MNFYVVVSPQDLLVLEEQEVQTDKDTQLFSNDSMSFFNIITAKLASTNVLINSHDFAGLCKL